MRSALALFAPLAPFALGLMAAGCASKIGDACSLSTDCAIDGTRVCDTSQPGGYCTLLSCAANTCPDDAACVMFQPSVPGCPYDDYQAPARTARAFCMAACGQDSDCRQSEGYTCADVTAGPWNAAILDQNKSQRVCIESSGDMPDSGVPDGAFPGPAVCSAGPNASFADGGGEASVSRDAAIPDAIAPSDASAVPDGGVEGSADGGLDAGATDSSLDAGMDVSIEAAVDTGAADVAGGG